MVITAGRQLARSLELQSLNDLGFSKRYVRCLQISEIVNSMKDLMDICTEQKLGPIGVEEHSPAHLHPKNQMQEMEQVSGPQGLPTDRFTLNKLIALHPVLNGSISNNNQHLIAGRGGSMAGSAQAALALTTYQNLLMRQNSMNSTHNNNNYNINSNYTNNTSLQQEVSSPYTSYSHQGGNISTRDGVGFRSSSPERNPLSRSTSFKGALNGESQTTVANVGYNQKALDVTRDLHLADELVEDVAQEFIDNGFFGGDLDDNDMNFSWKA
ncbi:hypothetical protein OROGR_011275 [Orobanche gracilis]